MNIHCFLSIFLFFYVHSTCEGKFYFTQESAEMVKDGENELIVIHGQMKRGPNEHYCQCSSEDCECCYKIGTHSICSVTKLVTLADEGNELAIQGKLTINNGSIFTCSIKFKEIPKMCYQHDRFVICLDLKQEEIENNKLKICGHIMTRYSTTVLVNADLFCKTFEVEQSVGDVREKKDEKEDSSDVTKLDYKDFFSQYFGQFALQ